MKIYLNAQFSDGHRRTHLLSVGMISGLGTFYRILGDYGSVEHAMRDAWVREHVLLRLPVLAEGRDWNWITEAEDFANVVPRNILADELLEFVARHPEPELWGWQSGYAYTAVRRLFGRLTDRPAGFPAWCGELAAVHAEAGSPSLPSRGASGHHALEQAAWARNVDKMLRG